jgi:hypothetical protein
MNLLERNPNLFNFEIEVSNLFYKHTSIEPFNFKIDNKTRVISRTDDARVLGIVQPSYSIIKHQLAFEIGCYLFRQLFQAEPEIFNIITDKNGAIVYIDILSEDIKIIVEDKKPIDEKSTVQKSIFLDEQENAINEIESQSRFKPFYEEFYPFIRIVNSYNNETSLIYKLGYYRWKCWNGMITGRKFESEIVLYHINKNEKKLYKIIDSKIRNLSQGINRFKESVHQLKNTRIPHELLKISCFDILGKIENLPVSEENHRYIKTNIKLIEKLFYNYYDLFSNTALTPYNMATDVISNHSAAKNLIGLQENSYTWLSQFSHINMDDYFNRLDKTRSELNLTGL